MPSPFPGMDPYLELHWSAVHTSFIVYARDQIQEQLPSSLRAEVETRVYVETQLGAERSFRPDVHVVETLPARPAPVGRGGSAGAAVAEALVIELPPEEVKERFINILDAATGGRVITTIELLSPSNKLAGEGQVKYRQKQQEALASLVNLVEIDLVRVGRRVLMVPQESIPVSHRTTYQACVRRGCRPSAVEIYRLPLRERLPLLPIPLRQGELDIYLDLQEIVDRCYRTGRYGTIDYSAELDPPLDPPDAAWATTLLREHGRPH